MAKLINETPTTLSELEKGKFKGDKRPYLGMSLIGHNCARYIWYTFRWAYTEYHSARLMRLFNRGHREEPEIIKQLNNIGVEVHSTQLEFVACWGHMKGHCDGIAENVIEAPLTSHLAEFKTMNEKAFKEVCKVGVKQSKPIYYGQCQIGMKFFKLKRALFVSVNKNNDAYYVERIKYEPNEAKILVRKAEDIITSDTPPIKHFKPTWYECKYCSARNVCHFNSPADVNCRTCKSSTPEQDGEWVCERHGIVRTIEEQKAACEEYSPLVMS